MEPAHDDSLMSRFEQHGLRCFRARDAIVAVAIAATVLVLVQGGAIRRAGEQMKRRPRQGCHAAPRPARRLDRRPPAIRTSRPSGYRVALTRRAAEAGGSLRERRRDPVIARAARDARRVRSGSSSASALSRSHACARCS